MDEKRPGGPEWSSDWVQCLIINNSGDTLTLTGNTMTGGGSFQGPVASIPPNSPEKNTTQVIAFMAYGETGLPSGCGGVVTYHFTNGVQLLLQYNCSVSENKAWCIPLLQAPSDSSDAGTDSYFCTAVDCTAVSQCGAIITIAPLAEAGNQSS